MKSTFFFSLLVATFLNIQAQSFENFDIGGSTQVAASFISNNEGWVADNNGMLFHTANGGQTWDSIATEKNFVALEFTSALTGYALEINAAYKTTNGGQTWSALTLPGYVGKSILFLDNLTGFVTGYQMIFKTTDGGMNWTTIYTEDVSFLDLYFINSSTGVAVTSDGGNRCIWRTGNGGESWLNVLEERKKIPATSLIHLYLPPMNL
jgi:photosystem II stability/assembly factor-like uncharacterized protein